jgi:DNA (cytosine-5)-methyltransferase 1
MLSVRECLRLMGYTDDFILPVSLAQGYKQAGNSIVVDVMMKIVDSILEHGIFEEE